MYRYQTNYVVVLECTKFISRTNAMLTFWIQKIYGYGLLKAEVRFWN
jgi:hypothetical protein